jgi:outer membrane protein W
MAVPTGNSREFIENTSYIGFVIDGRRFADRNVTYGIQFGWNIFHEETKETINIERGAISGRQFRYYNMWPILVNAHYYLGRKRDFRTYIGAGIGTYYILQRYELGVFMLESNNWHFGIAPEIGFLIPVSRTVSVNTSIKYNYAFDSGKSVWGDDDNAHSFVSLNVGLAFTGF